MKKGERQNRILREGGRKAAAGLAGCLLVGLTVMCLPMNVSASEKITRENFDYVRYADDYQDLKEAFGYDAKALYNHYRTCGIAEQRTAYTVISAAEFDHKRYADDYQDLKEAFGYDAEALYNHYLNNGKAEGRIAYRNDDSAIEGAAGNQAEAASAGGTDQTVDVSAAEFDHVRYANDYQDLKKAFGYDAKALYNHYLNNGKAEGRIAYRNDGSVIGNPVAAASAGTEQTAAANKKSENKIVTSDGWEWNEKWGMWVR